MSSFDVSIMKYVDFRMMILEYVHNAFDPLFIRVYRPDAARLVLNINDIWVETKETNYTINNIRPNGSVTCLIKRVSMDENAHWYM